MLISGREAVRILLARGAVTGEAQARSLLRTGAAGWGSVTGPGVLFETAAVVSVAERPFLSDSEQQAACPEGMYIARVGRSVSLDLTRPWSEVATSLATAPTMPAMTSAVLSVMISASGRLPWVATFQGFVVLGADLIGLATDDEGVTRFLLEPPGDWFEIWEGTRVASARGGRPWVLRGPRALAQ